METDLGKIVLCHREHERGVGHEYVAVFAVECHELVFAFLEGCECLGASLSIQQALYIDMGSQRHCAPYS